jgi:transposase InsO family protein
MTRSERRGLSRKILVKTFERDYARHAAKAVMQQLGNWIEHYNTKRPHSTPKYLPPRAFREQQALINQRR